MEKKKPGPAPRHGEAMRQVLNFRVMQSRLDRLKIAAVANGRSVSEEAEARINASFEQEDLLARLDRIERLLLQRSIRDAIIGRDPETTAQRSADQWEMLADA